MSTGQLAGLPGPTSDARYVMLVHDVQVSSHARKSHVRQRPSVLGVQLSFQLALLVIAALTLGLLVALAVFQWIGQR